MSRTIPGVLLACVWLLLLLLGSYTLFWLCVMVICLSGGREVVRMLMPEDFSMKDRLLLTFIFSFPVIATFFSRQSIACNAFGLFVSFVGITCFVMYRYSELESPLETLLKGVFGTFFIGFLASFLVMIRGLEDGAHWLIILTAITAGSDSCAYWIGSKWGKTKLCPNISPNKTREGAIGGISGGVAAALLLYLFLSVEVGVLQIVILGVFLSIFGIIGDLIESIIKRGSSRKDSGSLLGAHGGVLDRVDSLLMAAPVMYYTLLYFGS
ncbi:MAG: CDP-archaeol synthase [Desulfobulbaceae bacterium]|nr:MAG: CDP-archaeol synthase [Desulfobulbaceae bacterium]